MMTCRITFTQYYEYEVEANNEDEAFDKAYELYHAEMVSPIAKTHYDEYDIEILHDDDDDDDD